MPSQFAAAVARASARPRLPVQSAGTHQRLAGDNPASDKKSPDPAMTVAHLLNTAVYEFGHVDRHLGFAMKTKGDAQKYNLDHATKHLESMGDHLHRGVAALNDHFPAIGKEYAKLNEASNTDLNPGAA